MFIINLKKIKAMIEQRAAREDLYSTPEYWDSKADELDGDAVSMWPNNHLNALYHNEQIDFIHNHFPSVSGLDLMDLGCGTGRLSRWFSSQGANVTGIDFSDGALEIARGQTSENTPDYRCLSMFEINEKNRYDLIFCWGSVAIACKDQKDLTNVMNRLGDSLRPGGQLLMLEPIHKGPLHRVLNMSVTEFTATLSECGFDVIETRALHFWPMRLALAYVPWPGFITKPLYFFGQWLMSFPGMRKAGDYHGIHAQTRNLV